MIPFRSKVRQTKIKHVVLWNSARIVYVSSAHAPRAGIGAQLHVHLYSL